MTRISKDNLEVIIKESTSSLIEMARNNCWNIISENYEYFLSRININDTQNHFDKLRIRKTENDNKKKKKINEISNELIKIYSDLYDLNLFIYKSEKDKTFIEIQYVLKSDLEKDYFEKIKTNETMIHQKISIPPYRKNESEKFDVNWELGGLRTQWNLSLWRLKNKLINNNR